MNPQVRLTSECSSRSCSAEVGGDDDGCVSERTPPRVEKSDIYTATTAQSSPAGEMKTSSSLRRRRSKAGEWIPRMIGQSVVFTLALIGFFGDL